MAGAREARGKDRECSRAGGPSPAPPLTVAELTAFEDFYRQNYRLLVRIVLYIGGSTSDAEDAPGEAMTEVLQRWRQITNPPAYARRAVVTHFLKSKERGLDRVRARLREHGEGHQEGQEDTGLIIWEDKQWVTQLLDSLRPPSGQSWPW